MRKTFVPFGPIPIIVELRDNIEDDLVAFNSILKENSQHLLPEDVRGGIVLDIGSYTGMFSLLAGAYGAKKVYAYEPQLDNFNALVANINLNKFDIDPIRKAVGAGGIVTILAQNAASGTNIDEKLTRIANNIGAEKDVDISCGDRVERISLSSVIGDKEIAFAKIDIEGDEFDMFIDAPTEALKKIKKMSVEFHIQIDNSITQEFENTLSKIGDIFDTVILPHNSRGAYLFERK